MPRHTAQIFAACGATMVFKRARSSRKKKSFAQKKMSAAARGEAICLFSIGFTRFGVILDPFWDTKCQYFIGFTRESDRFVILFQGFQAEFFIFHWFYKRICTVACSIFDPNHVFHWFYKAFAHILDLLVTHLGGILTRILHFPLVLQQNR